MKVRLYTRMRCLGGATWGREVARTGTELYSVAIWVVGEHETLAVESHAVTQNLVPIIFQNLHGAFEVLDLECVVSIFWLYRRFVGLNQVDHDAIIQLQPSNLRIRHLTLDLLDTQEFVVKFHGSGSVFDHGGDVIDLFRLDLS